MMNLFIGCSASNDIPSKYIDDCRSFLCELFNSREDINLVFGLCASGLMGLSYEVAFMKGRDVLGVYPKVYEKEALKFNCKKIYTDKIDDRTDGLIQNSDALIFLPGGIGTLYELFTSIERKKSYEFDKPIIIYNASGYYDKLFEFLDVMYDEKFTAREIDKFYYVCNDASDAINYIDNYYNNSLVKKRLKQL